MTFVRETVEQAAVGVAVVEDPENFSVLKKPGVAATILRRQLPSDFHEWMDSLPITNLPSARLIVGVAAIPDAVEAVFGAAKVPDDFKRRFLVDDVVSLATNFASLMETEFVRLRFDVVQDNACRKFHIDAVTARLVCTYRGAGTQYGISTDGLEPKRVFSVPTGSPILLRGTKWPEPPASGLLHRSPPIEGSVSTRLVFVVDPVVQEPEPSTNTLH